MAVPSLPTYLPEMVKPLENTMSSALASSYSSWEILPCSSMAPRMVSCRSRLFSLVQELRVGSYMEGLLVIPIRLAHSASVRSDTSLLKYIREAVTTP